MNYYVQGLTQPDSLTRRDQQERLFVALGHVLHLLEDTAQPSHTRNDSHSKINGVSGDTVAYPIVGSSELERFGLANLNRETFDSDVERAIDLKAAVYFRTYNEFFNNLAVLSNNEFFSDGTFFGAYALPDLYALPISPEMIDGEEYTFATSLTLTDPHTGSQHTTCSCKISLRTRD